MLLNAKAATTQCELNKNCYVLALILYQAMKYKTLSSLDIVHSYGTPISVNLEGTMGLLAPFFIKWSLVKAKVGHLADSGNVRQCYVFMQLLRITWVAMKTMHAFSHSPNRFILGQLCCI